MKPRTRDFGLCVSHQCDGALLTVSQRLVLGHGAHRELWRGPATSAGGGPLLLDLSGVTQIDAAGIGLLAELVTDGRRVGRNVRIVAVSRRVRTLLTVTGLTGLVDESGGTSNGVRRTAMRAGTDDCVTALVLAAVIC